MYECIYYRIDCINYFVHREMNKKKRNHTIYESQRLSEKSVIFSFFGFISAHREINLKNQNRTLYESQRLS